MVPLCISRWSIRDGFARKEMGLGALLDRLPFGEHGVKTYGERKSMSGLQVPINFKNQDQSIKFRRLLVGRASITAVVAELIEEFNSKPTFRDEILRKLDDGKGRQPLAKSTSTGKGDKK